MTLLLIYAKNILKKDRINLVLHLTMNPADCIREFAEAFCLLNITAKYDESQLQKEMIQDIDYKKKRQ